MRISDWSSDVCSSDLLAFSGLVDQLGDHIGGCLIIDGIAIKEALRGFRQVLHIGQDCFVRRRLWWIVVADWRGCICHQNIRSRSEEHTSELQSLMRISYAVFCLKKKKYIVHL